VVLSKEGVSGHMVVKASVGGFVHKSPWLSAPQGRHLFASSRHAMRMKASSNPCHMPTLTNHAATAARVLPLPAG
jgi:hypothetical protein